MCIGIIKNMLKIISFWKCLVLQQFCVWTENCPRKALKKQTQQVFFRAYWSLPQRENCRCTIHHTFIQIPLSTENNNENDWHYLIYCRMYYWFCNNIIVVYCLIINCKALIHKQLHQAILLQVMMQEQTYLQHA